MITDNKGKWHYLALKSEPTDKGYMQPYKSISKLFRRYSSKHDGNFYFRLLTFLSNKKNINET